MPSADGCGSLGMKINTEYLPAIEMENCCNAHDICYDTCNKDKELCDIEFKRCLYNYCDSHEKTTIGSVVAKGCKAAAKMLFTGNAFSFFFTMVISFYLISFHFISCDWNVLNFLPNVVFAPMVKYMSGFNLKYIPGFVINCFLDRHNHSRLSIVFGFTGACLLLCASGLLFKI